MLRGGLAESCSMGETMATYISREELAQFVEALAEEAEWVERPHGSIAMGSAWFVLEALLSGLASNPELAEAWNGLVESAIQSADLEKCPGCGSMPGQGINDSCNHPEGCGYWKANES